MSRDLGILNLSANFEVNKASPLDAREVVTALADLTNPTTFGVYAYLGMTVSVTSDGVNNGLYKLNTLPNTILSNWEKIGSGGGISEAPSDGFVYGRKDSSWAVIEGEGKPEDVTLHRDINGNIESVSYEVKPTLVITRDTEDNIISYTNSIYTWTVNRTGDIISSVTVEEV